MIMRKQLKAILDTILKPQIDDQTRFKLKKLYKNFTEFPKCKNFRKFSHYDSKKAVFA